MLLLAATTAEHAERDQGADAADQSHEEQHSADCGSQRHRLEHRRAHFLALFLPVWDYKRLEVGLEILDVLVGDALVTVKVKVWW